MDRGYNRSLAIDLFDTGRITERIMEGQQASDKAQKESHMRLGYMGHLTLIAEEVLKFTEKYTEDILSKSVIEKVHNEEWVEYVENILSETRERDNAILGGVRPDVSLGPRQAVLNAVNAASGFGNDGGGLSNASLSNSGGNIGLDSMELATAGDTGGDEDMDDVDNDANNRERQGQGPVDDSEQVGEISFDDADMDYR